MKGSEKQLIVFEAEGNNPDGPYSYDGRPYQRHDSVTSVMPHDKYDQINDPIKLLSEVENNILDIVKEHSGISRINIVPIIGKSEATVKRALKVLGDMEFVEYRGSKKTGGYFSL